MNKKIIILILVSFILLGIFFRIASLNNNFTGEETEFIKAGISIANSGHPIFYQSEQQTAKLALWHPPLYIYSLAFLFKIFPITEITARSLNILFSLLTAGLIFLFCLNLIGKEKGKIIGLTSSALFLINYYVLSSSILIDLDVFSMFFVFGFIYFILRNYQTEKKGFLIYAGIFLFFGIWNRYPMMFLTYVFIGGYFLFNRDLKKYFKNYFLIGLISGISFLIIWFLYSTLIEPGTFFSFVSHNANLGSEQFSNKSIYIGSFLLNISQFIRLFTLPATILMIWSFVNLSRKKSKLTNILLWYILPIMILFIFIPRPAFGYPRYFMTILPGIFILISIFLYQNLRKEKFEKKDILLIILSFVISLTLLILLNPQGTFYESNGLIKSTNLPDFVFNLLGSIPILFIFLYKKNKKKILILILIALLLSYCLFFDINLITHESHIKETGKYLNENMDLKDIAICPYTVGYYLKRGFYNNDHNLPKSNLSISYLKKYFIKSYQNRLMNDSFFWPEGLYSGLYDPLPSKEELQKAKYIVKYYPVEGYEPEKIIGNFYIYKN